MRISIVGSSVVVAGSAALAALAPGAGAAAGLASAASGQYNSAASAAAGNITAAGHSIQGAKVSTTQATGQDSQAVPSQQATAQLQHAAEKAIPGSKINISGSNLLQVSAASLPTGETAACAAVLASGCQQDQASSIRYDIGLGSLGSALKAISGVAQDSLQLTIVGPNADCGSAAGGQNMTSSVKPASATAQLLDPTGKPVGGQIDNLTGGNLLSALQSVPQLGSATSSLSSATPVTLINKKGSAQHSANQASAQTGEFGLSVGNNKIFDFGASQVTCGPVAPQTGSTAPAPTQSAPAPSTQTQTTAPVPTPTTPAATPQTLKKVQTDEGRSPASSAAPAWLALSGTP